jgi:hypothetical protein
MTEDERRANGARESSASVWLSEGDKRPKYPKPLGSYDYFWCDSPKLPLRKPMILYVVSIGSTTTDRI